MPEIMMRLIDGLRLEHAIANLNFQNGLDKRFMYELVRSYPTIDAEPVRHGKFVFEKGDGVAFDDGWICTACKFGFHTNVPYFRSFAYCPNCGAKMDRGDSDAG